MWQQQRRRQQQQKLLISGQVITEGGTGKNNPRVAKFVAGASAPRAVALNALVGKWGPTNTPVVLFLSFGNSKGSKSANKDREAVIRRSVDHGLFGLGAPVRPHPPPCNDTDHPGYTGDVQLGT